MTNTESEDVRPADSARECDRRRPGLLAMAALCESVVTSWEVAA